MTKKIGWGFLVAILILVLYFYELIGYGIAQAKGQFKVLWHAQPIAQLIKNPTTPDSIKQKLILVNEIRNFAFDSLGLTPTNNYTTYYDQKGKEILWVVSACKPYKFEPKQWSFPIIGSFTYKGFFELARANKLITTLKKENLDVEINPVSGWSTLGWFKDPVLSNMLEGTGGSMGNTLIHELTHGTVFIPDSMTFNENLASFIGQKGAYKFLVLKYGGNSIEAIQYAKEHSDRKKFTQFMVQSAHALDSIYAALETHPLKEKEKAKLKFIASFKQNIDTVSFINPEKYTQLFNGLNINNAGFVSFLNYRERQNLFEEQLSKQFNNDLTKFISYWKNRYPN